MAPRWIPSVKKNSDNSHDTSDEDCGFRVDAPFAISATLLFAQGTMLVKQYIEHTLHRLYLFLKHLSSFFANVSLLLLFALEQGIQGKNMF